MSALEVDTRQLHAGWDYRRQGETRGPGGPSCSLLRAIPFHILENMHGWFVHIFIITNPKFMIRDLWSETCNGLMSNKDMFEWFILPNMFFVIIFSLPLLQQSRTSINAFYRLLKYLNLTQHKVKKYIPCTSSMLEYPCPYA